MGEGLIGWLVWFLGGGGGGGIISFGWGKGLWWNGRRFDSVYREMGMKRKARKIWIEQQGESLLRGIDGFWIVWACSLKRISRYD